MGRGESDAVPPPSPSLGSFALGEASRHAGRTLGQPVGSPCGEKRGASLQRPAQRGGREWILCLPSRLRVGPKKPKPELSL